MRILISPGKPDAEPIADGLGPHSTRLVRHVKNVALVLALSALGFALLALLGYATHVFALVNGGFRPRRYVAALGDSDCELGRCSHRYTLCSTHAL